MEVARKKEREGGRSCQAECVS